MNTNKTLTIVAAIVIAALAVVVGVYYFENNNGNGDNEDIAESEYNATFQTYADPDHPTTSVKYKLNGEEISGTLSLKGTANITVTVTSTEKLYGAAVNILPHFSAIIDNEESVNVIPDENGNYVFEMDAKIYQVFSDEDVVVSVSPYYMMLSDWPSASTHTTIKLGEGLTCTYNGDAINDGDVITVSGSQTFHLIVDYTSSSKKTLIWSGEWGDGNTAFGGIEKAVFPYDIGIYVSATFNDIDGTLEIYVK